MSLYADNTQLHDMSVRPFNWVQDRLFSLRIGREVFMPIDQALLSEIITRILSVAEPQRIILFGSAAAGEMSKDSDIDLLVLESAPGDTRKESVRIRQAVRGLGYPFDIIVMATERFEKSKNVVGGIAYPANKYGKVIYEAA
jgi:predicted nucleotidyltransferase